MNIYDFENRVKSYPIKISEIKSIDVVVSYGDEVVTVHFKDGTQATYDACESRKLNYEDAKYTITGDEVEKWINFKPNEIGTASYERAEAFGAVLDDDVFYPVSLLPSLFF